MRGRPMPCCKRHGRSRPSCASVRTRPARPAAFRTRPSRISGAPGLWYLLKPKKFGGPELRPDVALSVADELARADGSAGWVWAVMTIHDLLVALWPEEFQKEYWAKNTLSASSFAPTGKAAPANGGYKISGKWTFSSGIDNADWLLLGVFFGPPSGGSPIPDIRYVMLPKGDYKVIDDWFVFGLRGSGSKGILVEDVFVPNHRICGLAEMIQGTTPGSKMHDSPLYKASVWGIIPFTISSPANGMARGGLDAFLEDMKVREGSYDHSPLANKPGMHLVVAEASAMIDAADLLYRRSFSETIDKIMAGEPLSLEHRARSRRDQGWSVMQAKLAAEKLFSASAGGASTRATTSSAPCRPARAARPYRRGLGHAGLQLRSGDAGRAAVRPVHLRFGIRHRANT